MHGRSSTAARSSKTAPGTRTFVADSTCMPASPGSPRARLGSSARSGSAFRLGTTSCSAGSSGPSSSTTSSQTPTTLGRSQASFTGGFEARSPKAPDPGRRQARLVELQQQSPLTAGRVLRSIGETSITRLVLLGVATRVWRLRSACRRLRIIGHRLVIAPTPTSRPPHAAPPLRWRLTSAVGTRRLAAATRFRQLPG